MKTWFEIYSERMNKRYTDHLANKYSTFLEILHSVKANHATEIGCGAGNITRILREMTTYSKANYTLIDNCPKMLSLAIQNNPVHSCKFMCANILDVSQESDLIHSHGVLEHFRDEDIQLIIEMGLEAAPVQIHYVPGAKYKVPSRGDERLLEPDQWEHILRRYRKVSVSTFNDDFDIMLEIQR